MIKEVSKVIQNEAKEQKGGHLLSTLATSLLGSPLAGKGVVKGGNWVISAGGQVIRSG